MFHPDLVAQTAAAILTEDKRYRSLLHTAGAISFPVVVYECYGGCLQRSSIHFRQRPSFSLTPSTVFPQRWQMYSVVILDFQSLLYYHIEDIFLPNETNGKSSHISCI